MHNNSNGINNRSVQRRKCFTHRGVCHLDSILHGCWEKDKMVSTLHSWHSLFQSPKQQKTVMDKHPKSWMVCTVPPTSRAAGSVVVGSLQLSSSPLGLGLAGLGLSSGMAHLCCSVPAAASTPSPQPVRSAGLSCVCHLELHSSRGMGRDGQQWERDKVCRAGPGDFLRKKWNKTAPLPGCAALFFPPKSLSPERVHMVQNSSLAPPLYQRLQENLGHLFST